MNIVVEIEPGGYFQARPDCVGLTQEEAERVANGTYERTKFLAMVERTHAALTLLAHTPHAGRC